MISFEPSEEQQLIRDSVASCCSSVGSKLIMLTSFWRAGAGRRAT